MKNIKFTKEELQILYDNSPSISDLARNFGKSIGTIRWHLIHHGIKIRTSGYKSPKHVKYYGDKHYNWKGGHYTSKGYVFEYCPDHPNNCDGYVLQHRLVVERSIGRILDKEELVHHINGVKTDNRIENLAIMKRGEHIRSHKVNAPRDDKGRFS
jgi:hypothetical protein